MERLDIIDGIKKNKIKKIFVIDNMRDSYYIYPYRGGVVNAVGVLSSTVIKVRVPNGSIVNMELSHVEKKKTVACMNKINW